jgi:hypothetical protein
MKKLVGIAVLCVLGVMIAWLIRRNGGVTMREVPIVGLPCMVKGQAMDTTLLIDASGDGHSSQIYGGWGNFTQPPAMTLRADATLTLHVRIAACSQGRDCRDQPRWIGGEQVVEVDTRDANATVVLAVAGEHACHQVQ